MKRKPLMLSALALGLAMAMTGITGVAVAAQTVSSSSSQLPSLAPMLENVMPSVVNISIEGHTPAQQNQTLPQSQPPLLGDNTPFCQEGSPFQSSPMCQGEEEDERDEGATGGGPQQTFQALGAGVIINAAKGYVVTNNHVVENADKIQVHLNDGRNYEAKIIGRDPRSDVALIQLQDFRNLTEIKLADSDQLRVGDYAVAIGNPYGLGETATSGIISALGRSGLNIENYEDFIQTDAAINRGNSGGALVNLQGELIGLNTAILAPGGGNIGIGFAIPSNIVKNLTNQIVEFGEVKRGELGIVATELNSDLARAMKVDAQRGTFVSQIQPGSAAAKAGIKAGDVIVSMNGKPVGSFSALRAQLGSMPVGSQLTLGVLREGKPMSLDVTLEPGSPSPVASGNLDSAIAGAELSNIEINGHKGVKVDNVKADSAAASIGLKPGDIILGVNQQPVENLGELRKIIDSKPPLLALNIRRGESDLYLLIQ
ncbi:serine endoprotease DegP [Dickeya lacustris]|uniref:Serine endoprotease DegP n=1 Tax=Dickeya lacustris TaxID=2259638 RepID=A0ABY8GC74_9GAMM|nr:serine endoprotease DegP [Dickeya lacustris]WFN57567.1 serine endoprotease DegP [Dickeya lacustris]